jgi:hypothetical protein
MAQPYTVLLPGGGSMTVNASDPEAARINAGLGGTNATVVAGGHQTVQNNGQTLLNPNAHVGAGEIGRAPNSGGGNAAISGNPITSFLNSTLVAGQGNTAANPITNLANTPGSTPAPPPNPITNLPNTRPNGATSNMAGNPLSQGNIDDARKGILYNLSDPEFALQNALADRGVSTYNPIVNRGILPAARGLASAYSIAGSQGNYGPDYDVAQGFKDFLGSALGGMGGGIKGVASSALNTLRSPGLSQQLANAANLSNSGVTPENPFLAGLLPLLSSPESFVGLQGSLSQPLLGSGLSNALGQLQALNVSRAYRNVNSMAPNSFLEYLMGR